MSRYGIIDLGSNTIRLVVYDVRDTGKVKRHVRFSALINEKKVAGLSAYIGQGRFTEAGIEKAVDVLSGHLSTARKLDCKHTRIFATAVLRNCTNSAEAVKEIEKRIGKDIDLISGRDEAHLGFVGADWNSNIREGVLIDIGGGSTELTRIEDGEDTFNVSLDQGSVSSFTEFVEMIMPTEPEIANIRKAFLAKLNDINTTTPPRAPVIYGIGGSVRAVAKMHGRMHGNDKAAKTLTFADVEAILKMLGTDPSTFAHLATKAVPDRLHTLVPGCVILHTVMDHLNARTLNVCKYGIREGYLLERIL